MDDHSQSVSASKQVRPDHKQSVQEQSQQLSNINKNRNNNNRYNSKKRYKYCCRKCKHTQRGRKSCVCVVPMTQRRTNLTDIGCQTCGCKGCSVQDYISRGQDPQYQPREKNSTNNDKDFCCRKCSKSGHLSNKPCICQLPKHKRKGKMPAGGCKLCNCHGCNNRNSSQQSQMRQSSSEVEQHYRSRVNRRSKSRQSSSVSVQMDQLTFNLNNIDRSSVGTVVRMQYSMIPSMLGMGVPQRTPSYILGKPL